MDSKINHCVGSPIRLLFIGNSATYVHDLPGTLSRLAQKAGYPVECASNVKGGAELSKHADYSSELGQKALEMIRKGYDIVFMQDNGNCVSSEAMKLASRDAARILGAEIFASGAKAGLYVRPPYGHEKWGLDPFAQCHAFDTHFLEISQMLGSVNVYVNRAFAFAIRDTSYDPWGPDHAHISEYGAYLAVCTFFATIFNTSSAVLDANGLPPEDARVLQEIADKVALQGQAPW